MENAERDQNRVTTLIAVSSVDGVTPIKLYADPITHRLLVDATGSGASPLTTKGDIYVFSSTNTRLPVGTNGQILVADSTETTGLKWQDAGSGTGDVVGPASSTDNAVVRFDSTTGKLIQNSGVTISDTNVISSAGNIDSSLTASELVATNGSKQLVSLAVATYPSLTEMTYVKGVTSAIQTQLNAKAPTASPTFTGVVSIPTGSETDPSLTFTGDTNTGIYQDGADVLAFTTGGTRRARIDNDGKFRFYYVIQSNTTGGFYINAFDGSAGAPNYAFNDDLNTGMWSSAADTLDFTAGGTTRLTLTTTTLTSTVTLVVPANGLTINATNVTSTGTQLNYLNAATGTTGTTSTNIVFSTSPTLVTPVLGVASATSINKLTITTPATGSTLTILDGKTFTVNNTITLAGTDSTVMTFPTSSKTIAANDGSNWTIASQAVGDILYASTTTAYTRLAAVAVGQVLVSAGTSTAPAYSANPQVTSIELGAATDTTLARVAAGIMSVEGETLNGYATTATAAGTTTLTIASAKIQFFTGTTTQTVKLPTTGVVVGQQYIIYNKGTTTGAFLTVQSSGSNDIMKMSYGVYAIFTANTATPTTAAHWDVVRMGAKNTITATSYTTDTGTSLNVDYYDEFIVTAQAGALLINNPSGTPRDGQTLIVAITGTGARAITYGNQFEASTIALPSTTVTTARLNLGFIWRADTSKWVIIATC